MARRECRANSCGPRVPRKAWCGLLGMQGPQLASRSPARVQACLCKWWEGAQVQFVFWPQGEEDASALSSA